LSYPYQGLLPLSPRVVKYPAQLQKRRNGQKKALQVISLTKTQKWSKKSPASY